MRIALLLIVCLAAPLLFAQRVPLGSEGKRITSIELQVKSEGKIYERAPDSASRRKIFEAMRIGQGKVFNAEDLRDDIKYLTETSHMFTAVDWAIDYDPKTEAVDIRLVFTQPLIWRIRVVAPLRGVWTTDGVKDFWRARNQMDSAEGAEFSIRRMDADVTRMYSTGGFLDIRTEYKYTEKGVDLLFRVIQNQPLSILKFSGVYQLGFETSLELVVNGTEPIRELPQEPEKGTLVSPRYFPRQAFKGEVVTDANAANILGASEMIKAYYRVRGFPTVDVRPRLISLPLKYDAAALREGYGDIEDSTLDVCESLIKDGYGGKLVLIFEVHEGPEMLVGEIRFKGLEDVRSPDNNALEGARLRGFFAALESFWYEFIASSDAEHAAALGMEMRTTEGGPFVEADVVRDAETLQNYLRQRGWLDAHASFSNFELNETRNRVNVVFSIDPGSVYAVSNVRIEYATRVPNNPAEGQANGFEQPVITWAELLEALDLEGTEVSAAQALERFGADYLLGPSDPAQGHWFASFDLAEPFAYDQYLLTGEPGVTEGFAGAIRAILAEKGYSNIELEFIRVETRNEFIETGWNSPWPVRRTEMIIRLQQGHKSIVGKVTLRGNEDTRDEVIRRYIDLYSGDVFNANRQHQSEIRLRRTQWFEQGAPGQGVTSRTTIVTEDGIEYTDIDFDFIEGRTNRFNFAAGFNSSTGFTATVDLTLLNFDISSFVSWIWGEPNFSFTGAGQQLTFSAQPPLDRQQVYRISFTEPWLFGYPLTGGVSGSYETLDRGDYTRSRIGVDPFVGWRVLPDVLWSFGYSYEIINITDISSKAPQEIKDDRGENVFSTLWSEIHWSTTDNPQFPTEGWDLTYRYEYTGGPLLGGTIDMWKMRASGSLYLPIAELDRYRTLVLALNLQGTWQDVHDDTEFIPFSQRLFLGGNSVNGRGTLRGFEYAGVGPSRENVAIGGNFLVSGFAEIRLPIFPGNLWAVAFIDAGELSPTLNTFDPKGWTVSGGFGLRLLLPILPVPFALDFGFPIINQPGNREQVISINLGFGF